MYDSTLKKQEASLMIHQVLNMVEEMKSYNADCPRAQAIVITKLEEALMWLHYQGRRAPNEWVSRESVGRQA